MTYVFDMTTGVWSDPTAAPGHLDTPAAEGSVALRLESVTDSPAAETRAPLSYLATLDITELLDRQA